MARAPEEAEEEEDSQVGEELKDVSECLCPVQFPSHGQARLLVFCEGFDAEKWPHQAAEISLPSRE